MSSLREGLYVEMARAAHDAYIREARGRGETVDDNPSTVPWDQLDEDLRQANLDQALSVGDKLDTLGCAVVPLDEVSSEFAFDEAEVEHLARGEHERWMEERARRGWRRGPRDDAARTHPDFVPWEQLTELARQKDRDAVAAIPDQLREAGFQIVRGRAKGSRSLS